MAKLKIHTSQNVLLDYPIANAGIRIIAAFIDLIVAGLYIWGMFSLLSSILRVSPLEGTNLQIFIYFLVVLPAILYLPVSEYLWQGQTVGKKLFKLQVIRTDGAAPSLGDYILRWLLRTIDVKLGFLFIFFIPRSPSNDMEQVFLIWASILMVLPLPLVGIISMAISPLGQRIGDRVADTTVIVNKRKVSLDDTILLLTDDDYQPRILNVLKLSDKDIYIIKNALEELDKTGQHKNVNELGMKAKEILEIKEDIKPLPLLKLIIRDYNHMANQD